MLSKSDMCVKRLWEWGLCDCFWVICVRWRPHMSVIRRAHLCQSIVASYLHVCWHISIISRAHLCESVVASYLHICWHISVINKLWWLLTCNAYVGSYRHWTTFDKARISVIWRENLCCQRMLDNRWTIDRGRRCRAMFVVVTIVTPISRSNNSIVCLCARKSFTFALFAILDPLHFGCDIHHHPYK